MLAHGISIVLGGDINHKDESRYEKGIGNPKTSPNGKGHVYLFWCGGRARQCGNRSTCLTSPLQWTLPAIFPSQLPRIERIVNSFFATWKGMNTSQIDNPWARDKRMNYGKE